MRHLFVLFCLLFCFQFTQAQIDSKGYNGFEWGSKKSKYNVFHSCTSNQAGDHFQNCELKTKDSLFLNKYKYLFTNFRFYKGELCEINFDLQHSDLAAIVSELTMKFGSPAIKENKTRSEDEYNNYIGYEWQVGDTRILLLNKGKIAPVWCTINSISMQEKYKGPKAVDVEQLIFE